RRGRAQYIGMVGEKEESVGEGVDQTIGTLDAAAFGRYVISNVVEVRIGFRCTAVSRQRGMFCSAASRARPRCFTVSASSRIDGSVMIRPSTRAREASASST